MNTFRAMQHTLLKAPSCSPLRSSPALLSRSVIPAPTVDGSHSGLPNVHFSLAKVPIDPPRADQTGSPESLQGQSLGERIRRASKRSGTVLETGIQQRLEHGLGMNLAQIRVHTGTEADALARSVNAQAFTTGTTIFFRQGMYRPHSASGMHLLAHEVTHVVQQATGTAVGTPSAGGIALSHPGDHAERAAEASAMRIASRTASKQAPAAHPLPLLRAQPLASVPLVQRRVGYEFENRQIKFVKNNLQTYTNDLNRVQQNRMGEKFFKQKYQESLPKRKEPVIEGKYFTLEADDTMRDSNAEFVVHGPRPQKWGFSFDQKKQLVNTMHEVVNLAQKIDARGKVPFQATELDPRANEEVIIHNTGNEPYIVQATAGIRLDQLANVMGRVGKRQKEEPEEIAQVLQKGRELITQEHLPKLTSIGDVTAATQRFLREQKLIEQDAISPQLVSLLSLVHLYLLGGLRYSEGYLKNITPLMARTDFGRIFSLLPKETRAYFQGEDGTQRWVTLALAAAGLDERGSERFVRGLDDVAFTREEWLRGMVEGRDLLSNLPQEIDDSLGSLGKVVDPIEAPQIEEGKGKEAENELVAPIFEFRSARACGPASFFAFALNFFDYAQQIDAGNSEAYYKQSDDNRYEPREKKKEEEKKERRYTPPLSGGDEPPRLFGGLSAPRHRNDVLLDVPEPALARTHGKSKKRKCFITTACVEARGLPDDCYELTMLRQFRDTYLIEQPGGPELLEEYYEIAPRIVEQIQAQPDGLEILADLYDQIVEAVKLIEQEAYVAAQKKYETIVLYLKGKYLDGPRSGAASSASFAQET